MKWFTVVIQLYNSSNFTPRVTLQHHNLNLNPTQIVEGGIPQETSFPSNILESYEYWIGRDQAAENPQPSPLLQAPNQLWLIPWPIGWKGPAVDLFSSQNQSLGVTLKWGRVKCALGIPAHYLPLLTTISLFLSLPPHQYPGPVLHIKAHLSAF